MNRLPAAPHHRWSAALLVAVASLSACGGGSDSPSSPGTSIASLSAVGSAPLQSGLPATLAVSGGGITDSAYRGAIGPDSADFVRLSDSTLFALIPANAPTGSVTVEVPLGAQRVARGTLAIATPAPVANPVHAVDTALTATLAALPGVAPADVDSSGWTSDRVALTRLRDSAVTLVRGLSPAEQNAAAHFAASLAPALSRAAAARAALTPDRAAVSTDVGDACASATETAHNAADLFASLAASLLVLGVALALAPTPFTGALFVIGLVSTGAALVGFVNALAVARNACVTMPQIEATVSALSQNRVPAPGISLELGGSWAATSPGVSRTEAAATAVSVTLLPGDQAQVSLTGIVRPLIAADIGHDPRATALDAMEGSVYALAYELRDKAHLPVASLLPRLNTLTTAPTTTRPLASSDAVWSSSDPAVVTVSNGLIEAVAHGSATIRAVAQGDTATVSVTVDSATADSISVAPASGAITVGQQLALTAAVFDQRGRAMPTAQVTWSSSDATVATVASTGPTSATVTGVKAGGPITITAGVDGHDATASVTVSDTSTSTIGTYVLVSADGKPLPFQFSQNCAETAASIALRKDGTWSSDWEGQCFTDPESTKLHGTYALGAGGELSFPVVVDEASGDTSTTGEFTYLIFGNTLESAVISGDTITVKIASMASLDTGSTNDPPDVLVYRRSP